MHTRVVQWNYSISVIKNLQMIENEFAHKLAGVGIEVIYQSTLNSILCIPWSSGKKMPQLASKKAPRK